MNTRTRELALSLFIGIFIALAPTAASARVFPATGHSRTLAFPPDLSDVACPSTRVCYTVGFYGVQYNGVIFATTDGGHHWHAQRPGTKWGLRGITCINTAICYSVGYAETTVVTTDGGRTWHDPHIPRSPQALFRIACPARLTCIATGNSPNGYIALVHRIVRTTDGGRNWSYPSTPVDRTAYPMNGIACPTARVCYVVGGYASILITNDAGRTWHVQHNPAMDSSGLIPPLTAIACTSPLSCVAVGGFPDRGVVLRTNNGGRTWTSQFSSVRAALSGIACPTSRVCYVVGSGGTIIQSRDGGHSWISMDSSTSTSLNSIACHGPGFCVIVGNAGYIALLSAHRQGGTAPSPTPVPGRPTVTPAPRPTPTQSGSTSCQSWNVSGPWQFQSMTMGNGQATLQQNGTALNGTITVGGVTWSLQGTIQGANVSLTMSAPGQVSQSFQGMVSSDGTTIEGNSSTFSGGHAHCLQ